MTRVIGYHRQSWIMTLSNWLSPPVMDYDSVKFQQDTFLLAKLSVVTN